MNPMPPSGRRALPLLLSTALALGACSFSDISEKGKIDYKSAGGKRAPLDIPPDLVNPRTDDRYTIPEAAQRERTLSAYQTTRAAERPADTRVLPTPQGMRIERAGTQRWLVVDRPADKLWDPVREFWTESGFVLGTERPAVGVMETEWAENRAKIPQDIIRRSLGSLFDGLYSTPERDLFRTRLEPAAGGGTEIYISHRGMIEAWTDEKRIQAMWKPRPSDPELEAEFLRRLMVKLGAAPDSAKQLVAGSAQPGPETVRVVDQGATNYVEIREGFDRAWRRVGLALDRGGFTVEDRDRSKGTYFVRYIDPEVEGAAGKSGGFLSRMFSRETKATSAQQYRITVEGTAESARVGVLGKEGQALTSEFDRKTAVKILNLLREQLAQ